MARPRVYSSMAEAVADFPDGASLMIPGFGPGTPWNLLRALYEQGASRLTAISNTMGGVVGREDIRGLGDLIAAGRVTKLIASFTASPYPSRAGLSERLVREGAMEAEVTPQGTLAERIRAGGAGIPAFYTPAGVGTQIAEGKEFREFDGRGYILEKALVADYAFIRAWKADTAGNLVYRLAARNFNPIMAMAARNVIVEVEEPLVAAGQLDPNHIHTPGLYVQRLVHIPPGGIFAVDRRQLAQQQAAALAANNGGSD